MNHSAAKTTPGANFVPPPAQVWNDMVDAGEAWSRQRLSQAGGPPIRPRSTDIIKVLNTETDRRKGEILEINNKAITDVTDENTWLKGVEPDAGFFGILKEPVLADEMASLQVSGVCLALVDITDTGHTRADMVSGEYVLASGDSGPMELLYAPSSTGEQECVVRFGGADSGAVVVLQESLAAASDRFDDSSLPSAVAYHVKAKMVDEVQDGWELDPDRPITLFNRGENVAYTTDTLGTYKLFLGKLQFLPLDCAPDESSSSSGSFTSSEGV